MNREVIVSLSIFLISSTNPNFFHKPYHLPQLIFSPPSIPNYFSRHPYPHPFALPTPLSLSISHPQIEKSKQINNKFLQEKLTKGTWRNLENERDRWFLEQENEIVVFLVRVCENAKGESVEGERERRAILGY